MRDQKMIAAALAIANGTRVNAADAPPPRQDSESLHASKWLTSKYGLFVHHVFGGDVQHMTPVGPEGGFPKDIDAFVDAFDVEAFAEQVDEMGFEYVIFTAWHLNMNLLYPSRRMAYWRGPGHSTSRRDLIGEIADSLRKRGISLMVYTHVFVGHEFRPGGAVDLYSYDNKNGPTTREMRRTGYFPAASAPYGQQPPPPSTKLWNDFINDIYDEMLSRWGSKVDAMWFDGSWTWVVDRARLFETVRRHSPQAALVANGTAEHGYEFSSKEVGSPNGKDYGFASDADGVSDQDARTWPGYHRQVAMICGANWWASIPGGPRFNAEDIVRYTVLQSGINTQGGGVAWSFGTYADGSFESGLYQRLREAWKIMEPFSEGIQGTIPSQAFPTAEHKTINTLNYGFVATQSPDGRRTYIHVLKPPSGRQLRLPQPKAPHSFRKARLLGIKGTVSLKSTEASLTLTIDRDWDDINTVIVLEP